MTKSKIRRTPLRVQFLVSSLPVGGAEMLLLNLVRQLDRDHFLPEVCCTKEAGALAHEFARDVPVHDNLLRSKWDASVLWRMSALFRERQTDAVVTIGAGDKMFWGRLAAKLAGVPVICSALHSTGWPDSVGELNRMLSPITDGFIACAEGHAEFLRTRGGFPAKRIFTIPNGVDTEHFKPQPKQRDWLRGELRLKPNTPIVGIVAALRKEKNHRQFVQAARLVTVQFPECHFVIVGTGPERNAIEAEIQRLNLRSNVHLLGNRSDTENILAGLDVFCLTSQNEAKPVSILEALSCGVPVVAPNVGSVHESVIPGQTGILTEPLCSGSTSEATISLLSDRSAARQMGQRGRQLVCETNSLETMVQGYESLIAGLYNAKARRRREPEWQPRDKRADSSEDSRMLEQATVFQEQICDADEQPVSMIC